MSQNVRGYPFVDPGFGRRVLDHPLVGAIDDMMAPHDSGLPISRQVLHREDPLPLPGSSRSPVFALEAGRQPDAGHLVLPVLCEKLPQACQMGLQPGDQFVRQKIRGERDVVDRIDVPPDAGAHHQPATREIEALHPEFQQFSDPQAAAVLKFGHQPPDALQRGKK